jgi:hypothetical protein
MKKEKTGFDRQKATAKGAGDDPVFGKTGRSAPLL